ncbi:YtfJ family protein [Bisgaard Taxon 45]|uniref:YtfJ family protein n=1 Tax=Bisgaard Taxon 45 TaxID=304289 RepID=A0ABT9KFC7_9PAST|nr:YtfJ family protein [Bisgaard Taxon 45]
MKKLTSLLGIVTILYSTSLFAHNIQLNSPLATVSVAKDGELMVKGDDIAYQAWHSAQLAGKVRVVNHIAGRRDVKERNQALIEAIKGAQFDRTKYQTTTIINADDATFGTGSFVKSGAEKGKKANAHSQVVLDQSGAVKAAWQLKEKDSLVVVLDKAGKVKFVHEGALSAAQVQEVIGLIGELVK